MLGKRQFLQQMVLGKLDIHTIPNGSKILLLRPETLKLLTGKHFKM
jgi:hypothetical protein